MFRLMKSILLLALLQSSCFHAAFAFPRTIGSAEASLRSAIEKMGGEQKLRSLNSIQLEGVGHTYFIEQSERPEGPWIANYSQITELRDYRENRLRRATRDTNILSPPGTPGTVIVVTDGKAAVQVGDRIHQLCWWDSGEPCGGLSVG